MDPAAEVEFAEIEKVLWSLATGIGWVLYRIPGETAYKVSLASDEDDDAYLVYGIVFQLIEAPRVLRVVFLFDMTVPTERRAAVSEYFSLVNWRLAIGSYLIQSDIGEVRFRVGLPFGGDAKINDAQIAEVLGYSMDVMEKYNVGLQGVVAGGRAPADALRAAVGE